MMKEYTLFFFMLFGLGSVTAQIESSQYKTTQMEAVDNFVLNDAVRMFPNPVENILSVKSNLPITGIQVYSLLGELVKEISSNYSRIDLRDLNSGIYMIKIHSDQYAVTKKLIKK